MLDTHDAGVVAPAGPAPAAVLADIFQEVLGAAHVGPDDDFFSLGGDSLAAVRVVATAAERGVPVSLLDLFKNPTPRGACAGAAPAAHPAAGGEREDLLPAADRSLVPATAESAYPATRLQFGLIYENMLSGGALYTVATSYALTLPFDEPLLRRALDAVVARHPVLRTRFDLATFSEAVQLVGRELHVPLLVEDRRHLDAATQAARHEETMRALQEPFDAESAPLLRVHAAPTGPRAFRLSYSFHHAILDGWSESLLITELTRHYAALLSGEQYTPGPPAPFEEYVRLEREALRSTAARSHFEELRGAPLADLPGRGSHPGGALRKVTAVVPEEDAARLAGYSAAWGVPMKSLLLTADLAALSALSGAPHTVVGLSVSGRPETTGGDLTLGLFLNMLPLRVDQTGATWRTAAQRALEAERQLLAHRRFPDAEVRSLLGGAPFTSVFNYVRFAEHDALVSDGLVEPGEDLRERSSFPVRVEATTSVAGLVLEVTVDEALYGPGTAARLLEHELSAIHRMCTDPEGAPVPQQASA